MGIIAIIMMLVMRLESPSLHATSIREVSYRNYTIIGAGAISGAMDGVFESVARNRIEHKAKPFLDDFNLDDFALVATEKCTHIGKQGVLVVKKDSKITIRPAIVVDCQAVADRQNGGSLTDLGLIVDVNEKNKDIWHGVGYLVLGNAH